MFSGSTFLYFLSHLTVVLSLLQFYAVNKDKSIELLTLIQNHLKHVVEKLKCKFLTVIKIITAIQYVVFVKMSLGYIE